MKQFKEKNSKKKMIYVVGIGIIFFISVFLFYKSYAFYQGSEHFDVMEGMVPNSMNPYDVKLSVTIDGKESNTFPDANSGKAVSSILCTKGAEGSWDYKNWMFQVKNVKESRTKCQVNFVSKYTDSILNGADPVLSDELIPVTIGNNGEVKKASLGSEWYNYTNKVWANAVILKDPYVVYSDGAVIPEENIESYFVWIPRYKYKIFNEGKYEGLTSVENRVQEIEIAFENKDQAVSQGSRVGEWLSHPAFTSFNTNGMWVGKFETGYLGATSRDEALKNIVDSSKVQIKPNVYSWRGIQVAHAHLNSYGYKRNMDSHMMKNTEWGAVAYLSHSKYGIEASIRINNNYGYITGYAAVNEPTCGYTATNEECNKYESTTLGVDGTYTVNYKNSQSIVASTTGNYSGIYDMSGGAIEYVMGVVADQNGNPVSGSSRANNSNFIGVLASSSGSDASENHWEASDGGIPFPDRKFYDVYAYALDDEHYSHRILGDATGEMGPFQKVTYGTQNRKINSWYQDEGWFGQLDAPWFGRGKTVLSGTGGGIFAFDKANGQGGFGNSYRIVLSF